MTEELTPYQERMLEIEEEKLAAIKGIRKDLRSGLRAERIHYLLDDLDIDREDLETVFRLLKDRFGGSGEEVSIPVSDDDDGSEAAKSVTGAGADDDVKQAVVDAIRSATGKDVSVEIEEE